MIRSQRVALLLGYSGILIGALALWDAYEGRGARRPFIVKLLPGG
ncbi:hypothetical protein AB0K51_12365 [Kitasatospora sp. NPDC049285]